MKIQGWVILNKDGAVQGIGSGGYPFTPNNANPSNFAFFQTYSQAERYWIVINYGDKGYRIRPFFFEVDDYA